MSSCLRRFLVVGWEPITPLKSNTQQEFTLCPSLLCKSIAGLDVPRFWSIMDPWLSAGITGDCISASGLAAWREAGVRT